MFLESDIQLKSKDRREKFGLSNIFIISSILKDLTTFINQSIQACNITNATELFACKEFRSWTPMGITLNVSMEFLTDMSLTEYADDLNVDLIQKVPSSQSNESLNNFMDLRQVASINVVSNVTTFYHYKGNRDGTISNKTKLGQYFTCDDVMSTVSSSSSSTTISQIDEATRKPIIIRNDYSDMYWRVKPEAWVAVGLTISVLGVLISIVILLFIVFRIYMNDVLEG